MESINNDVLLRREKYSDDYEPYRRHWINDSDDFHTIELIGYSRERHEWTQGTFVPTRHELRVTFEALRNKWKSETATSSSKSRIVSHPSYLAIIEMGEPVLPFIFEEMLAIPDFWFRALQQITSVNPVLSNSSFSEAVNVWVDWGRKHGYVRGGEARKD